MVKCFVCLFGWLDFLHPINNLSVIKGRVFLGWTSTKLEIMFLLKDTTQWRQWGSNPRHLCLESSTLTLSHCAPYQLFWPHYLPTGSFCILLLLSVFFFFSTSKFSKKFFQEYHKSVKQFGSRSGSNFCQSWPGSKRFATTLAGFALGFIFLSPPFSPIRFFLCHFLELRARFWPFFAQK